MAALKMKVGDRVTHAGKCGVITRSHPVEGAWYVQYDGEDWYSGHYEYTLRLAGPDDPFHRSLNSWITAELAK